MGSLSAPKGTIMVETGEGWSRMTDFLSTRPKGAQTGSSSRVELYHEHGLAVLVMTVMPATKALPVGKVRLTGRNPAYDTLPYHENRCMGTTRPWNARHHRRINHPQSS